MLSQMRFVFVGAVRFSLVCLTELLENGANIIAVMAPAKEHARLNADFTDLEPLAQQFEVPFYRFKKINDPENVALLRSLQPDVIFVLGLSQLVSNEILSLPGLGCIGSHPALLPLHRGRHPIVWTLVEGLDTGGLTFFFMDEGADSGDILWQRPFAIKLEDDADSMYRKVEDLARVAIREFLPQLASGQPPRIPQDHSKATYWRKRTEADGEIHWEDPALTTYNLIRALARPYVGAHTFLSDAKLIVWKARLVPERDGSWQGEAPGTVVRLVDGGLTVQTGDGLLEILEWESPSGGELRPKVVLGKAAAAAAAASKVEGKVE